MLKQLARLIFDHNFSLFDLLVIALIAVAAANYSLWLFLSYLIWLPISAALAVISR